MAGDHLARDMYLALIAICLACMVLGAYVGYQIGYTAGIGVCK